MRLRLYRNNKITDAALSLEDVHRPRQWPDNTSPAAIPADLIGASRHSNTRDLRQQAVLHMQQQHGNAAVQRYLADQGMLPAAKIQRAPDQGEGSGQTQAGGGNDSDAGSKFVVVATIEGEKQGKFKGNSKLPGHEGWIDGRALSYQVKASSKNPDKHTLSLSFEQELDESSVQFFKALTSNETLKSATFELYHRDMDGKQQKQATLQFSQGRVVGVRTDLPNLKHHGSESVPERLEIDLTFEKFSM